MKKDQWVTEFVKTLFLELRPYLGARVAEKIALQAWPSLGHLEPDEAARWWHETNPTQAP